MPTFGSLFSGAGFLDLGLERAGWTPRFFVEVDPYCQRVLAKHWPHVPRWGDIREVNPDELPACDLLAGGFPCQDISNAGKRAGIDGTRSGLWAEFARIIRALRPRYVLVENVEPLTRRGLGRVLGDLADLGFDAEWEVLSAESVGAPHLRRRLFILAYAQCLPGELPRATRELAGAAGAAGRAQPERERRGDAAGDSREAVRPGTVEPGDDTLCDPERQSLALGEIFRGNAAAGLAAFERANREPGGWWFSEPGLDRVVDGCPARVDRLRAIGNGVVPHCAEWIGRRLMEAHRAHSA